MALFARSDTQVMLGDMLSKLLNDKNHHIVRAARSENSHPAPALWQEIVAQGVLGASLPESVGGFGGGARDLAVIMSAVGRGLLSAPVLGCALGARIAHRDASIAENVLGGAMVLVFALDEKVGAIARPTTRACSEADDFVLDGVKVAVAHASHASAFVVSALHGDDDALFLVEADQRGVEVETYRLIDGARGGTIRFDGARARRIADRDEYRQAMAWLWIGLAAETCGIMSALNEATFAYLRTREQFGAPLATFQALQHRAADMFAFSEMARALTDRAIDAADTDEDGALSLARSAKTLADEAGRFVGHQAIQLHGGMGVSDELDVSHYARRLSAIRATIRSAFSDQDAAAPRRPSGGLVDKSAFRVEVEQFVCAHLPEDIKRKGELGLEITKQDYVRWQKILRTKGWFAAAWPKEYGGAGWGLERQLIFVQEAARAGAPMISPYGVNMVGPVIYTFGTEAQKREFLPAILSSDCWWCQGYSEPNAGSDLASLKTSAVREGDEYVVNGAKMWTTEAHWADMMHCLVRTGRDTKRQNGISFLLIDMKSPGLSIRPIITIDGQHHTNEVHFDNVRVPAKNLVGEEGQGWTLAKFLLSNERVAIADTGPKLRLLAQIKGMLEALPKGSARDALRAKVVAAEIELSALCALELDYVRAWERGATRDGPQASVLKIKGTEILQNLSEIAVEVLGPLGAAHDPHDLHRDPAWEFSSAQRASLVAHQYLYGRCWSIFGGANEIQRNIIAKSIL